MKIGFLGAMGTVTGSKYSVRHGDASILVDCALFQGYKQLRLRNWDPLPVRATTLNAVVLTHGHIDHSGYLPPLPRQGFRGSVYCTRATASLCEVLLRDSAHLQEEEAQYANRHGYSRHSPALPLFTRDDAEAALRLLRAVDFEAEFAEVALIENMSAHADYAEIIEWLRYFERVPSRVFLTHGEPSAADVLRRRIAETPRWRCDVPDYLESMELSL